MKQILINELKKVFNLGKEDNLSKLEKDNKAAAVPGLLTLIKKLNDASTSPKEIALQVEEVVVCIALKDTKATELEKSLKQALENYQDKLESGEIEMPDVSSSYKM
ncbi:hypothetical protein [Legionella cardiaca]|uniref:Uncharacterized protein n=1 Tax=Legionella cardiaca TaxID=1071983 RepID=A0ABY8APW3_9GAMM|nr:hypothetical protein [Legionella cardiaca]WED42692.1 hypothetical protein PXX05_12410 [Legionella cardiaca]